VFVLSNSSNGSSNGSSNSSPTGAVAVAPLSSSLCNNGAGLSDGEPMILVNASNVVVDLNQLTLTGPVVDDADDADANTDYSDAEVGGIDISMGISGTTIKNGTVDGFQYGIYGLGHNANTTVDNIYLKRQDIHAMFFDYVVAVNEDYVKDTDDYYYQDNYYYTPDSTQLSSLTVTQCTLEATLTETAPSLYAGAMERVTLKNTLIDLAAHSTASGVDLDGAGGGGPVLTDVVVENCVFQIQPQADHGVGLRLTDMHPEGTMTMTDTCFVNIVDEHDEQGLDIGNSDVTTNNAYSTPNNKKTGWKLTHFLQSTKYLITNVMWTGFQYGVSVDNEQDDGDGGPVGPVLSPVTANCFSNNKVNNNYNPVSPTSATACGCRATNVGYNNAATAEAETDVGTEAEGVSGDEAVPEAGPVLLIVPSSAMPSTSPSSMASSMPSNNVVVVDAGSHNPDGKDKPVVVVNGKDKPVVVVKDEDTTAAPTVSPSNQPSNQPSVSEQPSISTMPSVTPSDIALNSNINHNINTKSSKGGKTGGKNKKGSKANKKVKKKKQSNDKSKDSNTYKDVDDRDQSDHPAEEVDHPEVAVHRIKPSNTAEDAEGFESTRHRALRFRLRRRAL
jgi:hypothetical protein